MPDDDRSDPTRPDVPALDDAGLRRLARDLAPLGDVDALGGLRGRSRDPRERPGTGGEQRDAAAALDAAIDRGELRAQRVARRRYVQLPADERKTAWWVAQRGRAVQDGATVTVREWASTYGALEGPHDVAERAERLRVAAEGARLRLESLKVDARGGITADLARQIDNARALAIQAAGAYGAAQQALHAWGLVRLARLAVAWDATEREGA